MDDQVLASLLELLEARWRIECERPDQPCSLARLAKRAGRPMSVLRRQLLLLADAGWVALQLDDGGVTGTVQLTAAGTQLCRELG